MKFCLTFLMICLLSGAAFSQKVKIKDEIASVDGVPYVQWKTEAMASEISVYPIDSEEEVIFMKYLSYSDPSKINNANPKGMVRWMELNFLGLELKCEIDSRSQKGLVKFLYDNKIFVDGALNEENVKKVIQKYGSNYSTNRPSTVIIINN